MRWSVPCQVWRWAPQAPGQLWRLRRLVGLYRGPLNASVRQQIRHFAVVLIRPAKLSDAASLATIAERTFRETFAADNSAENIDLHCAQKFSAQIQSEEISNPQLVTLLAEIAGELVGFAQLRLAHAMASVKGDRPAELHRIYVSSKWHGRGVANELMRAVYAAAVKAGVDSLWLGVWERNLKAIAFYRKCAFSVVGDHVFLLGQDPQRDLIMVAQLGSLSSVA